MSLSDTESNGRVLSMLIEEKQPSSIHNYCLGGIPDKKNVNYLVMNDLRNFKSLCTFGYIKPETNPIHNNIESVELTVKKRKPSIILLEILCISWIVTLEDTL